MELELELERCRRLLVDNNASNEEAEGAGCVVRARTRARSCCVSSSLIAPFELRRNATELEFMGGNSPDSTTQDGACSASGLGFPQRQERHARRQVVKLAKDVDH